MKNRTSELINSCNTQYQVYVNKHSSRPVISDRFQQQTRATNDSQVCHLWLSTKAKSTAKSYTYILNSFRKVIDKPLSAITVDDLVMYKAILEKKGRKPNTIATHLNCIKSILAFAHQIGYIPVDVGKPIPIKKGDTIHERLVESNEIQTVINTVTNHRDKMILTLMYKLGLRVSEVGYLKWENLRGNILSVTGKGNKTRHLIVPQDVLNDLMKLHHPNNTYIFETRNGTGFDRIRIHTMVKKYCKLAGVDEKISSHWFRHCHATTALKKGADIYLVSKSLGHSSIAVTGKYLHANPDECSSLFL